MPRKFIGIARKYMFFTDFFLPFPHILAMTRTDEDASFLRSIPYGILEEFRSEARFHTLPFPWPY